MKKKKLTLTVGELAEKQSKSNLDAHDKMRYRLDSFRRMKRKKARPFNVTKIQINGGSPKLSRF